MSYFSDFIKLFYPEYCNVCDRVLVKGEELLCTHCISDLPKTNFHLEKNNPVEMIFAGRIPIFRATAFCAFRKGNTMQTIIHQLKYKGNKEIGIYLGKMLGSSLMEAPDFRSIDTIIPVPLHKHKEKKRGYNQSEYIAKGIFQSMSKPIDTTSLIRITHTSTQTRKTRYNRWENVSSIFQLSESENLIGKHILLVDDVITTGATIEAAAQLLLSLPDTKVSVAGLAYATH
ncbi:MAG: ComF family protein [Bacteroidales bacterium]|jgi:ComF family protein|nr:ComF family protein [Bacteroidales bacterium]